MVNSREKQQNDGFNITQGLTILLGLLVPILGYLGDAQLSDIKREQITIRETVRVLESSSARDSAILGSIAERSSYFTALADERGRRIASLESDIGVIKDRVTRLEANSDGDRSK